MYVNKVDLKEYSSIYLVFVLKKKTILIVHVISVVVLNKRKYEVTLSLFCFCFFGGGIVWRTDLLI